MDTGVDLLVELAVMSAFVESGQLPRVRELRLPASVVSGVEVGTPSKPPQWSETDDQYLKDHYQSMTDAELAVALGRSEISVHLRWERDLNLPARSRVPGLLTAHQAAQVLGIDSHKTAHWVDAGLLPGRIMPGERGIRLVDERTLTAWAVNPKHWIYFDWRGITDPHLRRLCELRAERWGDEWWTSRQVADHHGVDAKDVERYIKKLGRLQGVQAEVSLGGRHARRKWANWFVLRSEATKPDLVFVKRKDIKSNRDPYQRRFSPAADAWILKARDELGMTFTAIGRTMKVGRHSYEQRSNPIIRYRYHLLKKLQVESGK